MFALWFILTQLAMSDATVIVFSSPFFTMILARIFINESFTCVDAVIVLIGFSGVLLVARPGFLFGYEDGEVKPTTGGYARSLVVFIGILGSIGDATIKILVRKLRHVPALVTVFYLMAFATGGSLICHFVFPETQRFVMPETFLECASLFFIAIFGFLGQVLKTEGLKREKAGPGSMMRLIDLILAPIW